MSDYEDVEQYERLKAFWAENGRWILSAIVLSSAGLFGLNWWKGQQRTYAESASQVYQQVVDAAEASDLTLLVAHRRTLADEYPESPYLSQAGLRLAALYMQRGETEAAEETLRGVLGDERGSALEPLVASRLARVVAYRGDAAEALQILDAIRDPGSYAPMVAELRGDLALANGDLSAAREAYQAALNDPGQPQLIDTRLVEIKLAALGEPESAAMASP